MIKIRKFVFILGFIAVLITPLAGQTESGSKKADLLETEYQIGESIAFSLSGNDSCSFVTGWITEMKPNSLMLQVREKAGIYPVKSPEGWIEVPYKFPRRRQEEYKIGFRPYIVLENPKSGHQLGLFICPRKFTFSTTSEKRIASIQRSVEHFLQYKEEPKTILEVPKLIEKEPDPIFASYLAHFVIRGGALAYPDYTLDVVSQLMENDKLLLLSDKSIWKFKMPSILELLIVDNNEFSVSPETREVALARVIKVASVQKTFTPSALKVLARVGANESINLNGYLDAATKAKLRFNCSRFTEKELSSEDRAVLDRLLAAK